MKKICISLVMLITLTGCFGFGASEDSQSQVGLRNEKNENFSLKVPAGWQLVDLKTFPVPKLGEVVYALKSPQKRQEYYNNFVVLKAERTQDINSVDLLNASEQILKNSLESYSLIQRQEFVFPDKEAGEIITFSGKYNKDTPTLHYIQSAKICDDTSYFLTLSVGEVLESYEKYEYILKTFECE